MRTEFGLASAGADFAPLPRFPEILRFFEEGAEPPLRWLACPLMVGEVLICGKASPTVVTGFVGRVMTAFTD
jgi:hypothetical protein